MMEGGAFSTAPDPAAASPQSRFIGVRTIEQGLCEPLQRRPAGQSRVRGSSQFVFGWLVRLLPAGDPRRVAVKDLTKTVERRYSPVRRHAPCGRPAIADHPYAKMAHGRNHPLPPSRHAGVEGLRLQPSNGQGMMLSAYSSSLRWQFLIAAPVAFLYLTALPLAQQVGRVFLGNITYLSRVRRAHHVVAPHPGPWRHARPNAPRQVSGLPTPAAHERGEDDDLPKR